MRPEILGLCLGESGGERGRARGIALDHELEAGEVRWEDHQRKLGAGPFRERDVPASPHSPVSAKRKYRPLHTPGMYGCDTSEHESVVMRGLNGPRLRARAARDARRLVDAAPEACCVPRVQQRDDRLVLLAHERRYP